MNNTVITEMAYAKINLFLDVTGTLDNGYHAIKSVMQSVSLCDVLTVEPCDCLQITCSDTTLPCDKTNLVYKSVLAFQEAFGIDVKCKIHIQKNIPMQAGLGGGSSDAAATLRALCKFYGILPNYSKLRDIGKTLGADVPFCVTGGTMLCEGIGEILTPLPALPDIYILVSTAGLPISTPEAYKKIDSLSHSVNYDTYKSLEVSLMLKNIDSIASSMYNIFEEVVLPTHDMAQYIKETMLSCGAIASLMSGSGPSVFGLFKSKEKAEKGLEKLSPNSRGSFICKPVSEIK